MSNASLETEKTEVKVLDGLSPWDILVYIGQAYDRLKQIRSTLYQMRYDLLAVPPPQANMLSDVLLSSIPLTVFTVIEALDALRRLDAGLTPQSQIYVKAIRKWEAFRDDSAHFAARAFLVGPSHHHELRARSNEHPFSEGAVFAYQFDADKFWAGVKPEQRISVVDALDAIRAIYQDIERRLLRDPKAYPMESQFDRSISRTVSFYGDLLKEDIDTDNEFDYLFQERYKSRSKDILKFIGRGSKSEEEIVGAMRRDPQSITRRVLSKMVREKKVVSSQSDVEWTFSKVRRPTKRSRN